MPVITNPARMLAGFTFHLEPPLSCYVTGCYAGAVLSANHARFGRVQACADHHPDRGGLGVGFGAAQTAGVAGPADATPEDPTKLAGELAALLNQLLNGDGGDAPGGQGVPRVPLTPQLPPSGIALDAEAECLAIEAGQR